MAQENDRKATGNAGANEEEIEERKTSGEEVPPSPDLRRKSEQPGAGANTPAGPFPWNNAEEAKRARKEDAEIEARDEEEEREAEKTRRER